MKHQTFPELDQRTPEQCLYWWPSVCKAQSSDWARGFALSIAGASKRRGWKPTDKQLGLMRKMVAELFYVRTDQADDDLSLIE